MRTAISCPASQRLCRFNVLLKDIAFQPYWHRKGAIFKHTLEYCTVYTNNKNTVQCTPTTKILYSVHQQQKLLRKQINRIFPKDVNHFKLI